HVGTGHHDLAHERLAELHDRVDVVAVVVFEQLLLDGLVDEREQLLLVAHAAAPQGDSTRDPLARIGETGEERRKLFFAHRRRSPTVNAATRSRWRPNISASSAGVA